MMNALRRILAFFSAQRGGITSMATPTTAAPPTSSGMKQTLGLTGVTVNAMALIAPGAFLWLTFQVQAAQNVKGVTTAKDMVPGLLLALVLAFLTAYSYSQLSNLFPKAGTGSSYYFAEAALLNREEGQHYRFARLAKFIVGWTSHLYYWIYPGLIVGTFSVLIQFIAGTFNIPFATANWFAYAVAVFMAVGVGSIAYRGIVGSTSTAIAINVIQIVSLVVLSILAIVYRVTHPSVDYATTGHSSALDVIVPHNFANVIFQATIAILLLVGFESVTALGAETKDAKKNIPRAILLSLAIQGLFCYLFEYFAANFFMGGQYTDANGNQGLNAAAASLAPIGDMAKIIGNWLGGFGFALTIIIAVTVMIALIGTTLACLNTGVRVTFAMGRDKEIPSFFGLMHGKFAVPHTGIIVLTILSALVGIYCSTGFGPFAQVDTLTQVTLISNIGTLLLYGMTCLITMFAFHKGIPEYNFIKHRMVPALGVIANVGLLAGIVYLSIIAGGTSATDAKVAMIVVGIFMVLGIALLLINSRAQNKAILYSEKPAFSIDGPSTAEVASE
jgi:APA family basic amino acid/polyamine antiporter